MGRICCVLSCQVTSLSAPPDNIFYHLPKDTGSTEENDPRNLWLKAINRMEYDGNRWKPGKYASICNRHFVGKMKSNDPNSPSYIPSLYLDLQPIVKPLRRLKQKSLADFNPVRHKQINENDNQSTQDDNMAEKFDKKTILRSVNYHQNIINRNNVSFHDNQKDIKNANDYDNIIDTNLQSNQKNKKFQDYSRENNNFNYNNINLGQNNNELILNSDLDTNVAFQTINNMPKCKPSSRWGHSLCMISENEVLLIGGQGEKNQITKDAIWNLDLTQAKWSIPDNISSSNGVSFGKPESRMGHSAVYDPGLRSLYVFGGSKNTKWFNDLHVLDIVTGKWKLVETKCQGPTRAYHSCILFGHELWIFGGVYPISGTGPDQCSNDVYVYSPLEEVWYKPIVNGEKPTPRSGHSGSLIEQKIVVFGGWDAPVCFNDLHILDIAVMNWSSPKITGTPPSPRSWHSSCVLSDNRILIHGGFNGNEALDDLFTFNIELLSWTQIRLEPYLPARTGHAALCLPYRHENNNRDQVLIFGGGDNEGSFFQDLVNLMVPCQTILNKFASKK